MTETEAKHKLSKKGFHCKSINFIPEGHNHYVFDIVLIDDTNAIAKFKKSRSKISRNDSLFGGLVSSQREKSCSDILIENRVIAPKYYYLDEEVSLIEKLEGKVWTQFISDVNFSHEKFIESVTSLGKTIANVHKISFKSYGDVISKTEIAPPNQLSFSDRFQQVLSFRLSKAIYKNVFSCNELQAIRKYFDSKSRIISSVNDLDCAPVMNITDLHGDNFLVDANGSFSGFFDLETCQSSHPSLEIYGLKFFIFNYFGKSEFEEAKSNFFASYNDNGNYYDNESSLNLELEKLHTISRLIELTESYYRIDDTLRRTWSDRLRTILFEAIEKDEIDYLVIGNVFRDKTKQPLTTVPLGTHSS
jgi:hypothetical protein